MRRATDDIIQLLALPKYVFPISGLCIGYPDEQLVALAGNQKYIADAAEFLVFCADFNRIQKACEYEGVKFEVDSPDFLTIATTDVGIALGQLGAI